MVVVKDKKIEMLIPAILGILFSIAYFILPIEYLLAAILGSLGLILILKDIHIGLMIGVFILPFAPDMLGLLYMFLLLAVFFFQQLFKRDRQELAENFMDTPIILYLLVIIISTITSIKPGMDGSLRDLALHLGGLSFLFVMVNTVKTKEDFNRIMSFLLAAASLVALYGLYQYVVGVELDAAWVDVENNPDLKTRVYSVFYNPNILAEYLIMLIPLAVGLFWFTKKLAKKIFYLAIVLIMSLALILTMSRGGWLGFAFSALIFIILIERRLLLSIIPISLAGVFFLPQSIINRILSIRNVADSSNAYRLKLWEITGDIIRDNPIAGVGFGHIPFKETFETYIRTMPTYHAHNTFLQVAAEIGLTGLLAFVLFLFVTFKYGVKILNKSEDRYIRTMGAAAIAGLGGLIFHGIVENVLYIPRIIITFWMLVSFILTLVRIEEESFLAKEN